MITQEGLAVSVMPPSPDGVAHRGSGMGSPLRPSSHDYVPCSRPLALFVGQSSPPYGSSSPKAWLCLPGRLSAQPASGAGVCTWKPWLVAVFGTRDASLLDGSDPARRRRCHSGECDKIMGGEARCGGISLPRSTAGSRSAVGPYERAGLGWENREGGTFQRRGETRVPLFHHHAPHLLRGAKPREAAR
jgi:hypothetical protein